jgi:hypothetical protein
MRVESREERDRWVSLLHAAARMTIHDIYEVDDSDNGYEFGRGRYAVVRPAKRRVYKRGMSFSDARYSHVTSHDNLRSVASGDSLSTFAKSSNNDLLSAGDEYAKERVPSQTDKNYKMLTFVPIRRKKFNVAISISIYQLFIRFTKEWFIAN